MVARALLGRTSTGCAGVTALPIVAQGRRAPGRREARGRTRRRRRDRLQPRRPSARRRAGHLELLPAIARPSASRLPVLLDGGIRRGERRHQGAGAGRAAVAVGRPALWGLAATASDGVGQVLELLRAEIADRADAVRMRLAARLGPRARACHGLAWERADAMWPCRSRARGGEPASLAAGGGHPASRVDLRADQRRGDHCSARREGRCSALQARLRPSGRRRPQPRRGAVRPVLVLAVARSAKSTRSTSSPASATTRWPPTTRHILACPRARRRSLRASRRGASRRRAGRAREARAAAQLGDADMGRVLLRPGLRRAVPDRRPRLIVANANDVVTALKCCGLRHMRNGATD